MEIAGAAATAPRKPEETPALRPSPSSSLLSFAVDEDPDCATLFVIRERPGPSR